MPSLKRQRGDHGITGTARSTDQRIYLILDDWPWGYSIRNLKVSVDVPLRPSVPLKGNAWRLPPPLMRLEAPRGCPWYFSAVGSRIVATHKRHHADQQVSLIDVRSRGITFGPGQASLHLPIYIPVGNELFALDTNLFSSLSLEKKLLPPRLEHECSHDIGEWSWCKLPDPPFDRWDVTSYALDSDGRTILCSTAAATFAFDTTVRVWERRGEWALPFNGRAHFVQALNAFVGLSKDPDTLGRLCSCKMASDGPVNVFIENLSSGNPSGICLGATLVHLAGGSGTEFCLVECISNWGRNDPILRENALSEENENWKEVCHPKLCRYRLTTFSLGYTNDYGGLTSGRSRVVQYFKVPIKTTREFLIENPVAFSL